jgi:hypothetical protein
VEPCRKTEGGLITGPRLLIRGSGVRFPPGAPQNQQHTKRRSRAVTETQPGFAPNGSFVGGKSVPTLCMVSLPTLLLAQPIAEPDPDNAACGAQDHRRERDDVSAPQRWKVAANGRADGQPDPDERLPAHRSTVSGVTITRDCLHPAQTPASETQKSQSVRRTLDRRGILLYMPSCWRKARFSRPSWR